MKDDTTIWPIMVDLLDCVEAEIKDRELPVPCTRILAPGSEVVLDLSEDCNGTLWVRLADAYPSLEFPVQDSAVGRQRSPICYTLEVGVSHDMDLGDIEDGVDAAVVIEETRLQMAYMTAMRVAICKCLESSKRDYLLQNYVPQVGGGSVDGQWLVFVAGA